MNDIVTTEDLVAAIKHTLKPYGMVHVDQVLAWLNKQADITRAECMAEEVANGRAYEEVGSVAECGDSCWI